MVAGVDSSTQATKVVVVDAATGSVLREGRAAHPPGTEVDPREWWSALAEACAGGLLDGVSAISVAGQQHGMVLLDRAGEPVRDALLWNDTRSAQAAEDLIAELGGAGAWVSAVGTVPVASITATKLRWTARAEPGTAERAARVMLPHDWLTWLLMGRPGEAVTDRGEASGTGYWSTTTGEYRPDLLDLAFGRDLDVPRVCAPGEGAGRAAELVPGAVVAAGTGDNMGAALGAGAERGDVLVSIGTSGTVFAAHDVPVADTSGVVAGFADATGGYLPLVATLNAARVLRAGADLLGVDLAELDRLALSAEPGAGGLVVLPYLEGERTPNRPTARGAVAGLTGANATPANLARAVVEGMLCGLADGLDGLVAHGVPVRRVLLIGGGSRSAAVQALAPLVFGVPVTVLAPAEYVALGAARQAAWALTGSAPDWARPEEASIDLPVDGAEIAAAVRGRYALVRG
ncbi:xylulokinase [Pseudonocardia acidicola]|uniref:Xylulose kinase n=1 Tax=Pseudonocardia acidicola TaxID=2724939 RepID=A0ABX1S6W0_9PSEU|nr:xylulokinase [Pseudonocardia acidicola]NMH96106.1 xylulokinase [Pseudonocardia acidicola]